MRKLLASLGLALFLLPSLASAYTCPNISQDMWVGSCDQSLDDADCLRHTTGNQVSSLQTFLKEYYNSPIGLWASGYFGNKTKTYVQKFQSEWDVPTTGRVGPLTRAAIKEACTPTGGTTPPPTPPPPPPTPPTISCNLSVSPSTITEGQSATLSWTSNNAYSGLITPGVGYVNANGSQSVSVLQSTTFQGTFYGSGQFGQTVASCSTQLTVSTLGTAVSATIDAASLNSTTATPTLTGTAVNVSGFGLAIASASGDKIYASGAITPTNNRWSHAVTQSLANGTYRVVLYSNNVEIYSATLVVNISTTANQSCTLDGVTWDNASYHTFYSSRTSTNCAAISQSRWCSMGQIQGDSQYQYANCTPPVDTGNPSITITAPASGTTLQQGSTVTFSWESQNAPAGAEVTLTFTAGMTIDNHLSPSGSKTWVVPNVPGASAVLATLYNSSGTQIASTQIPITIAAVNSQPSITITAPASGTSVQQGTPVTVSWTSANAPAGSAVRFVVCDRVVPGLQTSGSMSYTPTVGTCPAGSRTITMTLEGNPSGPVYATAQTQINVTTGGGTSPSISITAPSPGSSVQLNNPVTISWQTQNAPAGSQVILSWGPYGTPMIDIGGAQPVNGSYVWTPTLYTSPNAGIYATLRTTSYQVLTQTNIPFTITNGGGSSLGACGYKGAIKSEGESITVTTIPGLPYTVTALCDNAAWVASPSNPGSYKPGQNVCDEINYMAQSVRSDFGCSAWSGKAFLAVVPRHGNSALQVTTKTWGPFISGIPSKCSAYTVSWGDGTAPTTFPERECNQSDHFDTGSHTYSTPGTYTVSYSFTSGNNTLANSASVRVDSGNGAMAPKDTQLASALTALEKALKAIQQMLGQQSTHNI